MATEVDPVVAGRAESEPQRRRALARRLTVLENGPRLTVALVLAVVLLGLGVVLLPEFVPISLVFPLLVVAGLVLEPRRLAVVLAAAAAVVLAWSPVSLLQPARVAGVVLAVLVVMWQAVLIARSRDLVGTRGMTGDRMLAELRDRIIQGGRVPALPDGWHASSSILSAHGDRFSGDFVIVHLSPEGQRLEVALVDVSGKGTGAGTRSLLLSGALGGLLGAVPSADFLRAANDFLVRQGWDEGFATAVHVDLDLRSGEYSIGNAGHPAAAVYTSGRARWTVLEGFRGPLLGLLADVDFPRQRGRLGRGDAVLVYSDGVIEARDRDLTDGIDRMLGVAAMSVLRDGDVARDVAESARSGEDDDRAAFAVRRT
ncbi:PP2C family protein-serine/threonine phosphatase [Phycicoccus endophyticus]|uniref:PP2C family protein-serine/threonine phosphatase n=1 Tax=Phycicoccus endophyticus TaxID=1690220 RepID=UPI00140D2900|nr:PP2C family protein-serine/threonine phosphatase [Phycicoccus endophyticus]NHI19880.1 serine/threonine-protein phosphatase [Phycicoccus endophyticus]GGL27807.1 membrane protein [Phycicoccus endophyticus]